MPRAAVSAAKADRPATSVEYSGLPATIPNPAHTRTFGAPSAIAVSSTAPDSAAVGAPAANRYDPYDATATSAAADAARARRAAPVSPGGTWTSPPHSIAASPHSPASRATSSTDCDRSVTEQSPGRIISPGLAPAARAALGRATSVRLVCGP